MSTAVRASLTDTCTAVFLYCYLLFDKPVIDKPAAEFAKLCFLWFVFIKQQTFLCRRKALLDFAVYVDSSSRSCLKESGVVDRKNWHYIFYCAGL